MAEKLASIAGVDINEYGLNMLKAGSSVADMPASEIAKNDSKEFSIGDRRMLIGQISVMDTAEVLAKKDEIIKKDYSLVPSRYIEFVMHADTENYDEKMTHLQAELSKLLKEEETSRAELLKVMEGLGYGIK